MKYLIRYILGLLAFAYLSGNANAQGVFTKYGPVAGIQKSTGLTWQNTAAANSDVISLWGSSPSPCSSSTFLRGDGNCAVPAGTGVTSVGVTAPSWYTVTGSPVTSSGTIAITAATGQTANRVLATPDGTTGAVSLRALVAGDIPPINLGSTANGGVSGSSILLGTNGGTSNGFFSITGPTTSLKTFTFPNASATVLTTNAAVTVAQGGTGLATLTAHGVMLGEGTSSPSFVVMGADTVLLGAASADPVATAVNNCGSSSQALSYSTSTHTFGCQTISAGGTPGGSNTQVQYNNSSAFGGMTVTYNNSTHVTSFADTAAFNASWTNGGTNYGINIAAASPALNWSATGQATGDKNWLVAVSGLHWQLFTTDDSGAFSSTALDILRTTGTGAIASVSVGNATSNPSYAFLGTGAFTIGGVPATKGPPRVIWASLSATAGGCTVLQSNYITGCTRNSAGSYSIAGTSLNNNMGCTSSVTFTPSNGGRISDITGSSSGISVAVYNISGTGVDDNFQFVCMSTT